MYSRTGKCDELWPFHSRVKFAFNGQGSKIGCIGTSCSKSKPQKSAGGHMCISACSSSIGSWTASIIPILYRYWWRKIVSLCWYEEKKVMVEPEQGKNMSEMFQFLHLALHFLASTATLLSLNDITSICKLKHNNWTSNKKWQSINKPICTGIPTRETKSLGIMHQPTTESSNYYERIQTAVARGLGLPAGRLAGHHTDSASKHSFCYFRSFSE